MNILKEFAKFFIKSKLDKRKQTLREKLEKEIVTTKSEWVKSRNIAYLNILDKADEKIINEIEKTIDRI